MKITAGIPFQEYARQRKIPKDAEQYAQLACLYEKIQKIQEFIDYSYQFRPIGRETTKLYFGKLQDLEIQDKEKDKLIDNLQEIQLFVETQIELAKSKENDLRIKFESIVSQLRGIEKDPSFYLPQKGGSLSNGLD